VRIAFYCGAIHIGTRVSFVRIAYDIFDISGSLAGSLPFHASGEACSTSSAKPGCFKFSDDLFGRHFEKDFLECLVTISCNIFIDIFWIYNAAVSKDYSELLLIEFDLFEFCSLGFLFLSIEKTSDLAAFYHLFCNYVMGIFRFNLNIEGFTGKNLYDWAFFAESKTSCLDNLHIMAHTQGFGFLYEISVDLIAMRRFTARSTAH